MELFKKLLTVSGLMAILVMGVAGPAAAEDAKLPDGKVAVHYFRPDGQYEGWGLHTWTKGARNYPSVGWGTPLPVTGKDDFGVYWQMDADFYFDGKVRYIIHKGESKDQCGADKDWEIKDGKEVWANAGDCNVYMSKEEALKGRKK